MHRRLLVYRPGTPTAPRSDRRARADLHRSSGRRPRQGVDDARARCRRAGRRDPRRVRAGAAHPAPAGAGDAVRVGGAVRRRSDDRPRPHADRLGRGDGPGRRARGDRRGSRADHAHGRRRVGHGRRPAAARVRVPGRRHDECVDERRERARRRRVVPEGAPRPGDGHPADVAAARCDARGGDGAAADRDARCPDGARAAVRAVRGAHRALRGRHRRSPTTSIDAGSGGDRDERRGPVNPYRASGFLWRVHLVSVLLVVPQFTLSTYGLVWLVGLGWSTPAAGLLVGASQFVGASGGSSSVRGATARVPGWGRCGSSRWPPLR